MSTAEHYLVHIEYVKKHVIDAKILASTSEKAREKALEVITNDGGQPLEITITKEDDGTNGSFWQVDERPLVSPTHERHSKESQSSTGEGPPRLV